MPRILLILLFLFSIPHSPFSQGVYFKWAEKIDHQPASMNGYHISVDANKNVYLVGNFSGQLDLDPGPGTFNVTGGLNDVFVIKLDPNGNFLWGKSFGGDRYTNAFSATVDPQGNIYISGNYCGTTDFDPGAGTFIKTPIRNINIENYDIFMLLLDTNGDFKWCWATGLEGFDVARSIAVDNAGNFYVTGSFTGLVRFDPRPSSIPILGMEGATVTFVCKYDRNGNFNWLRELRSRYSNEGNYIRTDNSGNIYVTGSAKGIVDFDIAVGQSNYYNGDPNIAIPYLLKINPTGGLIWEKHNTYGNAPFDVNQNQEIVFYEKATTDTSYLTKLDMQGNLLWRKPVAGSYSSVINNSWDFHSPIEMDAAGNINITGTFHGTTDLDPGPVTYNMTSSGNSDDAFICNFDSDGNFVWAKQYGNNLDEHPFSMTVDDIGSVYTIGTFNQQVDFDPGAGVYNLTADPGTNVYIQKLEHCANANYNNINAKVCSSYNLNNQSYSQTGMYYQFLTNANGCDSVIKLNLEINKKYETQINKTICNGENYLGHTNPGTYIDRLQTIDGCDSIQTTILTVSNKPLPSFGGDTTLCLNDTLVLHAALADAYRWQDGSVESQFIVTQSGNYVLNASNSCGTTVSQIQVEVNHCGYYFPTAFTPNGDGRNDQFGILNAHGIKDYNLKIFNRWGEVVFESKNPTIKWDGRNKGNEGTSVFVWVCTFVDDGQLRSLKGTVAVIR